MKQKVIRVILIFICSLACSCVSRGDKEVEKIFNGEWKCQFYIDVDSRKYRVEDLTVYDAENHRYKTTMQLQQTYPVSVFFGTIHYAGDWKANDKFFYGKVDPESVRIDVNREVYNETVYNSFLGKVKNYFKSIDYKEVYFITALKPDDMRLYSEDCDLSFDLYKEDK